MISIKHLTVLWLLIRIWIRGSIILNFLVLMRRYCIQPLHLNVLPHQSVGVSGLTIIRSTDELWMWFNTLLVRHTRNFCNYFQKSTLSPHFLLSVVSFFSPIGPGWPDHCETYGLHNYQHCLYIWYFHWCKQPLYVVFSIRCITIPWASIHLLAQRQWNVYQNCWKALVIYLKVNSTMFISFTGYGLEAAIHLEERLGSPRRWPTLMLHGFELPIYRTVFYSTAEVHLVRCCETRKQYNLC